MYKHSFEYNKRLLTKFKDNKLKNFFNDLGTIVSYYHSPFSSYHEIEKIVLISKIKLSNKINRFLEKKGYIRAISILNNILSNFIYTFDENTKYTLIRNDILLTIDDMKISKQLYNENLNLLLKDYIFSRKIRLR